MYVGLPVPQLPPGLVDLGVNAAAAACAAAATASTELMDELPLCEPDIAIVNFYSEAGRLGLHQVRPGCVGSLGRCFTTRVRTRTRECNR